MKTTLFGSVRLGYVMVESSRLAEWKRFAADGLGLHVDEVSTDTLALRVDDRNRRLVVQRGSAEDVVALGWELDDDAALRLALERLREIGISPQLHRGGEAGARGVSEYWSFTGPKRTSVELFTTPLKTGRPLLMKASGFLTGAGGLGHVAITTREPEAMQRFWQRIFDARVSDYIEDRLSGIDLDFTFLRLNERHHSVAIAFTRGVRLNPLRTSIHHLNLQAANLEDVTEGYRRCRKLGYPIANAIGQHSNDRELSFYVETPSGFEIELGWNPIVVTEEAERQWFQQSYRGISLWGHYPENLTLGLSARRFGRGLLSLARREFTVGAKP
ncbi:VOC family protein [Cupriavidus taiwanensis]|uniref:VOC family protein n=1 Tax=Cupriavidus taiwanensis TaxID=164546 RepID=UPI000E10C1B5|nr:VOC family protein [Cupriavidus taiwanensis]SPD57286.1 Extradiol ring-cleavage dioxygenase [Cupriavidus taiwanensis]